jgi:hypothetical protein
LEADPSYTCVVDSEINDETRTNTSQGVEDLAEFFARPVKIGASTWAVGQGLDVPAFKPWRTWMQNKRVANRLNNFKNFRAKLHVKFIINGNSFYWGRAFVSYTPYTDNPFEGTNANSWLDIPRATQKPHIWIDPTSSQGGEMVLPFFWPNDHFDLVSDAPENLGNLWIYSPVGLRHAQGQTQSLTVTIYAWATDVSLSTPTQVNIGGLLPQAGDEYGEGPISKPANVMAAVARKLGSAPMIGPYAMATSIAAGAVGNIARMFGFSRPRDISLMATRRVWQTGDLASTDREDTCMTLGYTAKQEVTIDPRTVGLGSTDEMDMKYLMSKPTLFASFDWALGALVDVPIFSVKVTPMTYRRDSYTGSLPGYALMPTAMCALPFHYWRGSMTYRFQIVASGYHKGRLLFVWEPNTAFQGVIPESNVTYSKVVDIAQERDFAITIGWGSNKPALEIATAVQLGLPDMFSIGVPATTTPGFDNGTLTCYVLNPLVTSGSDTSSITILCHTSSDDMELWAPDGDRLKRLTYNPQGAPPPPLLEGQAGHVGDVEGVVENAAEETAHLAPVGGDRIPKTFNTFTSGETVKSLRTLLKRYFLRRSIVATTDVQTGTYNSIKWTGTAYPYMPDVPFPGSSTGVFRGPFTIHSLVAYCYAGWRGSFRIKLLPALIGNGNQWPRASITVSRGTFVRMEDPTYLPHSRNQFGANNCDEIFDYSFNGCQVSNEASGNVLDFEIPWYSNERFGPILPDPVARNMSYEASLYVDNPTDAVRSVFGIYKEYGAIGEDYNLFFFTGVPPIWFIEP